MKIKTIYVAKDGREFTNQEDCKNWEKSEQLRKDIAIAWYKYGPSAVNAVKNPESWVSKVAYALVRDYHIVKRGENGQTPNSSDDNR